MRYIISARNTGLTQGLQTAVESKLSKLERYFTPDTEVFVTLSVERDRQKIEVTIPMKGSIIRAEEVNEDMYTAIDLVQETIERQLRRYKTRIVDRNQAAFVPEYIEDDAPADEDEIRIVKTKRFAVKPMDPEEACLQMEMLGHSFFVFRNADTDQVCVVYRRKDGAFGLIEPEC